MEDETHQIITAFIRKVTKGLTNTWEQIRLDIRSGQIEANVDEDLARLKITEFPEQLRILQLQQVQLCRNSSWERGTVDDEQTQINKAKDVKMDESDEEYPKIIGPS